VAEIFERSSAAAKPLGSASNGREQTLDIPVAKGRGHG